jgi:hypothetical protein
VFVIIFMLAAAWVVPSQSPARLWPLRIAKVKGDLHDFVARVEMSPGMSPTKALPRG